MLAFTLPAQCLTVRGYNAAVHDRFTGFPAAPVMNPGLLFDASKFTGVGWWTYVSGTYGTIYSQITAVSPRHLLCASHARPSVGTVIHFIDSSGTLVDRTTSAFDYVPNDSAGNSDLCVITLAIPLPATVATYPWLNLSGGESSYEGEELMVLGQTPNGIPRAGRGAIADFEDVVSLPQIPSTRTCYFDYQIASGGTNDCTLTPGDSGGPSFASVGAQPALVCTHLGTGTNGSIDRNYDTFLPHYVTRVDTILAPAGHRLMPANFTATTLQFPAAAASPTLLRRSNPGSIGFSVANAGSDLTGNLALTISFAAGSEPSSLTASGWVVESGGTGVWHLRAATLAASTSLNFTANWTALPDLPSITANLNADSDTAAAIATAPAFTLAPSYAEWSEGLAMPGQTADPDGDDLENLFEYALGGDPEGGAMFLPGDHPLQPVITESGGTVSLSFPERSDAVLRGLSYVVETSSTLSGLAGAITLPAGASSSTAPFAPAVPGFVKRTITWPSDGPRRFARLKVELAE